MSRGKITTEEIEELINSMENDHVKGSIILFYEPKSRTMNPLKRLWRKITGYEKLNRKY
jgi:hypothetical protein